MAAPAQPIKVAILAMGGEGGGVLAEWITALGERHGWLAQMTSVPGVAQRTGATIYYVELFPAAAAQAAGAQPVLALMPLPGDVDIVLASEAMEAGRAVQRGLVTPTRTTLVASTHRVYAIAEKIVPGDGRVDADALLGAARAAAQRFVAFDMAALAERERSAISAVLFGALAATGALPFSRQQFEETVRAGGVGVQASLKAFAAAHEQALRSEQPPAGVAAGSALATGRADEGAALAGAPAQAAPAPRHPHVAALLEQAGARYSGRTLWLVTEGLRRLVDYQDVAYAQSYLDRLEALRTLERVPAPALAALLNEAARHLALWMSYEDTVRVADLKTRASRFERVSAEVRAEPTQLLHVEEYLHPRLQEVAQTLPAALGRWLLGSGAPRRLVERFASRGRTVRTSSIGGFALLACVASLRRWRRGSLRHAIEDARIEAWLADLRRLAVSDAALAVEVARCQRLVKGYGDTHARGWHLFERLQQRWRDAAAPPTAAQLSRWREAALADEHGDALDAALGTPPAARAAH